MKTRLKNHLALPKDLKDHPIEHGSTCILGFGSLMMIGVGILADNPVVAGIGVLIVGLLILSRLVVDLRSGITSSNWGSFHRDTNRAGFRCNTCFWTVIALFWFVLGFLIVFEWVRLPSAWVA